MKGVIGVKEPTRPRQVQIEAAGHQEHRHGGERPQVAVDEPESREGSESERHGFPVGLLAVPPDSHAEGQRRPPEFDGGTDQQEHCNGGRVAADRTPFNQVQHRGEAEQGEHDVQWPPAGHETAQRDEYRRCQDAEERQALHGAGVGAMLDGIGPSQVVGQDEDE